MRRDLRRHVGSPYLGYRTTGIRDRVKTRVEIDRVPIIASELRLHALRYSTRLFRARPIENLVDGGAPKRRDVFILTRYPLRVSPIP